MVRYSERKEMENKETKESLRGTNTEEDLKNIKKQKDVKISVIIPVYNVEKYLKRCLDSVITQTYENLEVICIDDGSTDHSAEILRFYAKKDSRIIVLTQSNKGPAAARNRGLDIATGQYISFVDADDFLQWNAYEILVTVAEENSLDLIMFGANTFPWGEGEGWINEKFDTKYKVYETKSAGEVIFGEKASVPFLWMHFIKRTLLESPGKIRLDETLVLGEDQLFQFLYVPRATKIMVIEDKLYNYQVSRNDSLMQLYSSRRITKVEYHLMLVRKIIRAWKAEGYFEIEEDNLATWMTNFIYYSLFNLPIQYKKVYAVQFIELLEEEGIREYLIADYEQKHYKEMLEWKSWTENKDNDNEELHNKIEQEKYEIAETLNSRAFRLGRLLTKKKERLNLAEFEIEK